MQASKTSTIKRFIPLAIIAAIVAGLYLAGVGKYLSIDVLKENQQVLKDYVTENPLLAAVIYCAIYISSVAVSFPGASLLTIAGGLVFGWVLGGFLTVFSATIGACIIFLIAKTSLGDILVEKAGERMHKLRDGFQKDAFNYLLTVRLAPVVPFWITNLAPALFGMDLPRYALATFIGIIPGTFAYCFIGEQIGSAVGEGGENITKKVALGLAALAIASVIPLIIKRLRSNKHPA